MISWWLSRPPFKPNSKDLLSSSPFCKVRDIAARPPCFWRGGNLTIGLCSSLSVVSSPRTCVSFFEECVSATAACSSGSKLLAWVLLYSSSMASFESFKGSWVGTPCHSLLSLSVSLRCSIFLLIGVWSVSVSSYSIVISLGPPIAIGWITKLGDSRASFSSC